MQLDRVLLLTVSLVAAPVYAESPSQEYKPAKPAESVDLGPVVGLARRLGADRLFQNRDTFIQTIRKNFLSVYKTQVDHAQFLTYPRAREVVGRIVEIGDEYIDLARSVSSLSEPCTGTDGDGNSTSTGKPRKSASGSLKRVRDASHRLERSFSGMFLELASGPGETAKPPSAGGDYCSQVQLLADDSARLKQRLIGYFFTGGGATVSVNRLSVPTIRSLTGSITAAAKLLEVR